MYAELKGRTLEMTIPKPPGQRRRRNAGQHQWQELPAEGRRGVAPPLPDANWLPTTLDWWRVIWRSPMSAVWLDADRDGLVRLAQLRDAQHRGELPVSALGQMTTLEDRFGLNPRARRSLQWEISRAEVVDHPTKRSSRSLRAIEPSD
jgi:hypothetical protein